jgi:hypothetical protein
VIDWVNDGWMHLEIWDVHGRRAWRFARLDYICVDTGTLSTRNSES